MNTLTQSTPTVQNTLTELFVAIDDLIQERRDVGRRPTLSSSECITIILLRYTFSISNWFALYNHIRTYHTKDFPTLGSYNSFIRCINANVKRAATLLASFIHQNRRAHTGIALVDSTPLPVCRNHKIKICQQAKGVATRGVYSLGWYYGLKLHLVSDVTGNILACHITSASVDERDYVRKLLDEFKGIIVADAGYVSGDLEKEAAAKGSLLLTGIRKNMKKLCEMWQFHHLQSRIRIETVFSNLKLRLGLVTSLPRSLNGLLAHYLYVLFAYQFTRS